MLNNSIIIAGICALLSAGCQNKLRIGGRVSTDVRPAQPAAPQMQPEKTSKGIDLADAVSTPKSVLILAIGHAEGTIDLNGTPTQAYFGHGDSGYRNVGVFSCISCGNRSAEEADAYYLENKIKPQRMRFEDAARGARLPENHPMLAAAFFTLLTQSPMAATDRKGFLDRMSTLKTQGINFESLVQLSVDSYRDPDTNTFKDVARFNNDELRIRADQKRRLSKVEDFLRNRGIELYPRL